MRNILLWIVLPVIICLVTFALIGVGLLYYLNGGDNPNDIPVAQRPVLNPHPQYFMTVKGHIDPSLNKDIKLAFVATYYTANKACNVTVNRFAGVDSQRIFKHVYVIQHSQSGAYMKRIPIDRYLPGRCDWYLAAIDYKYQARPSDDAINSWVTFFPHERVNQVVREGFQQIICDQDKCYFSKSSGLGNYVGINLSVKQNYIFTLNIVHKEL